MLKYRRGGTCTAVCAQFLHRQVSAHLPYTGAQYAEVLATAAHPHCFQLRRAWARELRMVALHPPASNPAAAVNCIQASLEVGPRQGNQTEQS